MKKILWISSFFLASVSSIAMAQTAATQPMPTPQTTNGNPSALKNSGLLNINKATHDQLTVLGLDDAAVDKIIQGRPYGKKSQLISHKILNQEEYSRIKDKIYAWWPMRAMVTR
jgi:DNA uptake protein ComE-like DNA-binding protein